METLLDYAKDDPLTVITVVLIISVWLALFYMRSRSRRETEERLHELDKIAYEEFSKYLSEEDRAKWEARIKRREEE